MMKVVPPVLCFETTRVFLGVYEVTEVHTPVYEVTEVEHYDEGRSPSSMLLNYQSVPR